MLGPDVAWYVAVAAVLFGIGALGVLIRRNTLVVLLSLELMLNAGNLALIALSRHFHNGAGQIFALSVMAGPDSLDSATLGAPVTAQKPPYESGLLAGSLQGKRFGVPAHRLMGGPVPPLYWFRDAEGNTLMVVGAV